MSSSGNTSTPEKIPVPDTEVVSVDLPAPDGWRKKFTPRKGGTPKRNEIMFISPTGEEITNKRQLEQYLRSHAGGPPSSEFDWGTGDTPRRSARLSSKTKATETSEDEKPKKKERKSSSKKGLKDKSGDTVTEAHEEAKVAAANKESADLEMTDAEGLKDKSEDTETEAPEEAKVAAANKEPADLEMTDAEGDAKNKEVVGAGPVDQGQAENKLVEKNKEDNEVETEEHNKEGPEEAVKVDTDASIPESGKEEKEDKETKFEDLPPVAEEKGDENAEKKLGDSVTMHPAEEKENGKGNDEKPEDPVVPSQSSEVHKEAAPTEKHEDLTPVAEERGDENAEKKLEDSEKVHPAEEKENCKGNDENPEDPVVPSQTSEVHKEAAPTEKDEDLPPVAEEGGGENAEKKLEDFEKVHPAEEKENGKGNDENPEDPVVQPQTSEVHKEAAAPTEKDVEGGVVPSENDSHIDNRDGTTSSGAQSANCEEGQRQPKAPPVC